jgi:hypothetical protein
MKALNVYLYYEIVMALLEIFRRFIWNIFRLENEQLSNIDQYRVTVDVPLPFERHTVLIEKDSPLEKIEGVLFKFLPCLRVEDDPLLDYETTIEEFIGKATKSILGKKSEKSASFRVGNSTTVELDEDDLAMTKGMERKQTELTFDSIGDTNDQRKLHPVTPMSRMGSQGDDLHEDHEKKDK